MKILKVLGLILLGLILIAAILSFIAPTEMRSERSIVINAPKDVIFGYIKNLNARQRWSPFLDADPNAKYNIEGTDGTVGAVNRWEGNDSLGKGSETISLIDEGRRYESKLHFLEPFESEASSFMELTETEGGVKVTWGFEGGMSRPFNVMGLFMDMDAAIGKEFTLGLERLKKIAESAPAGSGSIVYDIKEASLTDRHFIGVRETVEIPKLHEFYMMAMPKAYGEAMAAKVQMTGPATGLYYSYDEKTMKTDVAAAIPVADGNTKAGSLQNYTVKGGKALVVDFYGPYSGLKAPHEQVEIYMKQKNLEWIPPVIEEYVSDPGQEPDSTKWLTKIHYLVK